MPVCGAATNCVQDFSEPAKIGRLRREIAALPLAAGAPEGQPRVCRLSARQNAFAAFTAWLAAAIVDPQILAAFDPPGGAALGRVLADVVGELPARDLEDAAELVGRERTSRAERVDAGPPSSCSGAAYPMVPKAESSPRSSSASSPKSRSFSVSDASTMMFVGLRSR